ncbi:hypothetical protein [uncultured Dysosmobacter sp.]|uniref:hypothetical protein n=1 Tax=uncultured Dysosmobacter sp. TaxID=2591384 RepID=UPI002609B8B0|nr:hypothetical protein [uncultured Dysosmobacter sp.]
MDIKDLGDTIIKIGLCRYGPRQYRLFLCTSTFLPGTGDYEDAPEICNDREMECYRIWLEDMIKTDNICAGTGYYEHLSDAIQAVEESPGFERWIN